MQTIDIIKSRTSVRKYLNLPIEKSVIEDIIDCGRLAPTGHNKQAWTFLVITNQDTRNQISDECKYGKFIKDAGVCIAVFCDLSLATTGIEDACAATENMMIAAQAYNLGTCWVNSFKKVHSQKVKELLNCPENLELMTLFSIGHPDGDQGKKIKKSLDQLLVWEKF